MVKSPATTIVSTREKARRAGLLLTLAMLFTVTSVLADEVPSLEKKRRPLPRAVGVVFHVDPAATVWRRTVEGQVNLLGESDQTVTIGLTPSEASGQRDIMVEFRVPLWFGEWVSPPEFLKAYDLLTYGKFPTLGRRDLSLSGWQLFQVHTRQHPGASASVVLVILALGGILLRKGRFRVETTGGFRVADFRIRTKVGEGAMGEVYRAVDRDGQSCAVKLLRPLLSESREFRTQFDRELSVYSKLQHPNLPTLLAFGYADDGRSYMATEFLGGQTLKQMFPLKRKQQQDIALAIAEEVGSVLDYLHESGLIHQDVKPSNIFLTSAGDVKLLDLGVARRMDAQNPNVAGTPAYMAPEQFSGGAQAGSDQYSLGLVLFEVLMGRRPYDDTEPAVLAHRRATQAPPRTGLSPKIDHVLGRMLHPDPEKRFPTCSHAFRALRDVLS